MNLSHTSLWDDHIQNFVFVFDVSFQVAFEVGAKRAPPQIAHELRFFPALELLVLQQPAPPDVPLSAKRAPEHFKVRFNVHFRFNIWNRAQSVLSRADKRAMKRNAWLLNGFIQLHGAQYKVIFGKLVFVDEVLLEVAFEVRPEPAASHIALKLRLFPALVLLVLS